MQRLLAERAPLFAAFHEIVSAHFAERSAGKAYTRRPNVKLILPAADSPPGRLVVYPLWDPSAKRLNPETLRAELLVRRPIVLECDSAIRFSQKGACWSKYSYEHGPAALSRLMQTADEFIDDPFQVFRRSLDFCCLCHKTLTDAVSRARGIGPECLRHLSSF
jgi:hypothetical protein